jgi:hypothetical protein
VAHLDKGMGYDTQAKRLSKKFWQKLYLFCIALIGSSGQCVELFSSQPAISRLMFLDFPI